MAAVIIAKKSLHAVFVIVFFFFPGIKITLYYNPETAELQIFAMENHCCSGRLWIIFIFRVPVYPAD
jgi:TRAP-type mannitol/chloroaromatic compound transport system permease small subunit